MADMYGSVISNVFAVHDAERFTAFIQGYSFGGLYDMNVAIVETATPDSAPRVTLHGSEQ